MFSRALVPNSTVSCGTSPIAIATATGSSLRDVDAIERHASRCRIVEAQQQLERRALAGAGRTDERHRLARRDLETETLSSAERIRVATDSGT